MYTRLLFRQHTLKWLQSSFVLEIKAAEKEKQQQQQQQTIRESNWNIIYKFK